MKLELLYKSFNHASGYYVKGNILEVSEEEGTRLLETWADWFKKVGEGAMAEMKEELEEIKDDDESDAMPKIKGRPKKN